MRSKKQMNLRAKCEKKELDKETSVWVYSTKLSVLKVSKLTKNIKQTLKKESNSKF